LKTGTYLLSSFTSSPVLGFLAILGFLALCLNTPKPLSSIRFPSAIVEIIVSMKPSTTALVSTLVRPVMEKCSEREDTWISEEIIETYMQLHYLGMAHSVETFEDDILVGGLYGVSIGGAFFGESMFNNVTDASKGAFFYLIERLKKRNFLLLDSQYINPFTKQLGAIEVSYSDYTKRLIKAINLHTSFVD